jgi:hypothetical protein
MLTRMARILAAADWVMAHSAQLGAQIPTRSPLATPRAIRARARSGRHARGAARRCSAGRMSRHQGLVIREARHHRVEHVADGAAEQGVSLAPLM